MTDARDFSHLNVNLDLLSARPSSCTSADQFSLYLHRNGSSKLQLIKSDLPVECNSSRWRFEPEHFLKAGQKPASLTCFLDCLRQGSLKNSGGNINVAPIYFHLQGVESILTYFSHNISKKLQCFKKQSQAELRSVEN